MSTRPIRLGVVGAGQMSRIACSTWARLEGAELRAVADPHEGRARSLAHEFSMPACHANAREMIEREELDAIYLATPNAYHAVDAELALTHGLHVLVEKPFAISAAEAARLVELASDHGRVVSVALPERMRRENRVVRALVKSGRLGHVYAVKAHWLRRAGIPKLGTWFGQQRLAGGGTLVDIGVHLLDLALFLLDDFAPERVLAATRSEFGPRGLGEGGWGHSDRTADPFDVEDFATAFVRFADGRTIGLDVSWALHQPTDDRKDVILYGTEGYASCFGGEYTTHDTKGRVHTVSLGELDPGDEFAHDSILANFVLHLLGREELSVTPDQALAVQRVLDAIYRSARSGHAEPVTPGQTEPRETAEPRETGETRG